MVIQQVLTATGSQVRAQEDHQTGMDHRTACQLLIPHQIALEHDRVPQRDPRESAQQQWSGTSVVAAGSEGNVGGTANVLGIGRETGTENDGAG